MDGVGWTPELLVRNVPRVPLGVPLDGTVPLGVPVKVGGHWCCVCVPLEWDLCCARSSCSSIVLFRFRNPSRICATSGKEEVDARSTALRERSLRSRLMMAFVLWKSVLRKARAALIGFGLPSRFSSRSASPSCKSPISSSSPPCKMRLSAAFAVSSSAASTFARSAACARAASFCLVICSASSSGSADMLSKSRASAAALEASSKIGCTSGAFSMSTCADVSILPVRKSRRFLLS
mmetsp:Transcript_66978/g.111250  ORF Transcript_66978/g.111250 Transcript_66978/m.111250 type:complete len:236 (+) Transcript_66978:944-1651(+)